MKPGNWMMISFGCTLAVVVGMRLNAAGLLVVATILLSALLLCPLLAMRWAMQDEVPMPEVRVERPVAGPARPSTGLLSLTATPPRRLRRGGWPHLEKIEELERTRARIQSVEHNARNIAYRAQGTERSAPGTEYTV